MTKPAVEKALNLVEMRNQATQGYFKHDYLLQEFDGVLDSHTLKTVVKAKGINWMIGDRDEQLKLFAKHFMAL